MNMIVCKGRTQGFIETCVRSAGFNQRHRCEREAQVCVKRKRTECMQDGYNWSKRRSVWASCTCE
jgi:hypothetical protein